MGIKLRYSILKDLQSYHGERRVNSFLNFLNGENFTFSIKDFLNYSYTHHYLTDYYDMYFLLHLFSILEKEGVIKAVKYESLNLCDGGITIAIYEKV